MLPESKIDRDSYPRGPDGLVRLSEDRLAELQEQRNECQDKAVRRSINKHMHMLRDLIRWAKSRAGYTGEA